MSNLNNVTLQGNLVDDPKIMGEEKNVARFTVAVNNGFGDNASTTFADCVAFGKQVAVIGEHLRKGKQIIVNGQLMQNRWEDKEGNKRSKLEIRLNNFGGFFFVGNAQPAPEAQVEAAAGAEATATAGAEAGDGKLF